MITFLKSRSLTAVSIIAIALSAASCTTGRSQTQTAAPQPEALAAKGLEAAKLFPGLASLCDLDMKFRDVNVQRSMDSHDHGPPVQSPRRERPAGAASGGGRGEAALKPMQVFDDLYFLGNSGVAAWLVGTEQDGYVLIDALTSDEVAEREIIGGMEALGLDPKKIKHFVISHGHGDHYGGHRYLTKTLGLPVQMSDPDWALARTLGNHPRFGPAPTEGQTIKDGDVIRLGRTVLNIYVSPAHTPGTISPIITVHDKGVPHKLILWGGTGFNFGVKEDRLRDYALAAARFRDLSRSHGVDIFLSNHPARDGSGQKMQQLASRASGAPHPFVMGPDALKVFDVFEYCSLAQAERLASGSYVAD